ncbi:MAG: TonB-dependent receptor, partial [Gammaproteobacteria bacterium]
IQVIEGEELVRRQATTLGEALGLAMGLSVAPGGDGGPGSSVPEMMGLREFDAFLLVVDDVPWGGAFNPDLATLDLTNVERIEVLRGAAPVLYGATSFVGVIHIIHHAPDATPSVARASGGSYGTSRVSMFSAIPSLGAFKQSLTASYDKTGYKDDRTSFDRGHVLYRGAGHTRGGRFRVDFDATILAQEPASPHPREGTRLSEFIPIDSNHQPSDAQRDEDRYHLVLGHSATVIGGDWTTTVAFTYAKRESILGFLAEGPFNVAMTADGFDQEIDQTDVYFDSHLTKHLWGTLDLIGGVDELYGRGEMDSDNFEYLVNPDGSGAPAASSLNVDERSRLEDIRSFTGLYGQVIWTPAPRWRLELGARLNVTHERREAEIDPSEPLATATRNNTRGGGSVGVSFRAWGEANDAIWLFTDYRDTFKPAALDFGPEAESEILKPEDAQMVEAGAKGSHAGGRFTWEVSGFHMNFSNVVVATQVNGLPALENVGEETFDGAEVEASWRIGSALRIQSTYAYHDATFGDYLASFGGALRQLKGNQVEMSANHLANFGLLYLPATGFNANVISQYVGSRFLNKRNTAPADSYVTVSAGIGYRVGRTELRIDGINLSNRRDPVAESELGDAQYYLLPARAIIGTLVYRFGD